MNDAIKTPIINRRDAVRHVYKHGEMFDAELEELAASVGAQTIGANITKVQPGKAAFPLHHHRANEEHFYILKGQGHMRYGAALWPVVPGDYIVIPPGGPEHAHQIINTGDDVLEYLGISTKQVPEVVGYPDSAKTGVRVSYDYDDPDSRFLIEDSQKDTKTYWDGEQGEAVQAVVAQAKR